jgi:hypothetical protein
MEDKNMTALNPAFNAKVEQIAKSINIELTAESRDCDSLEKITNYYNRTGIVMVWTGASENTIFGNEMVNFKFRAWHDLIHITGQHAFDAKGERAVMEEQQRQAPEFKDLIECEVIGQVEYFEATGKFPDNQIEFAKQYLKQKGAT